MELAYFAHAAPHNCPQILWTIHRVGVEVAMRIASAYPARTPRVATEAFRMESAEQALETLTIPARASGARRERQLLTKEESA